jgi:hypothetical protein
VDLEIVPAQGKPLGQTTAKYMRVRGDIFRSNEIRRSQFWKSLHKVKHLFKWGAIHKVGDGGLTQFWQNVWVTSVPLRIAFPKVYAICENEHITIAECVRIGWQLGLRRMMSTKVFDEWSEMQRLLSRVEISNLPGKILWGLSANKTVTTNSLYKFLTSGGGYPVGWLREFGSVKCL